VSSVLGFGGRAPGGCRGRGSRGVHDSIENSRKTMNSRLKGKQGENKKGFVITIDAIAALSFMLLSLYFIQSMGFNPVILKGTQLKQLSLDTLSVLEKTGRLADVVEGNSTAAREILLASPEAVCMQLAVAAENKTVIATIDKPACGGIGSEVQISYGVFRADDELYSATLRSWYMQEALE
jgi:hypothetical protein